jgi:hypothetical protein
MSSVAASKRIAVMTAELVALPAEPVDGSTAERTAVAYAREMFVRRCAAMTHGTTAAIAEIPTDELGESSAGAALSTLLRISTEEANRRIKEAKNLGPRSAMTGEALAPLLSHTAAAQERGLIGAEHVTIIRTFFTPNFAQTVRRYALRSRS